jgi:hypothetical protein
MKAVCRSDYFSCSLDTSMRRLLSLLFIVALSACSFGCGDGISREGRAVLREGTRVEVFRVSSEPSRQPTGGPTIGRYPVLSQGKDLGPDFAARLADAVLGHPELDKKCGIQPGVAFRVWRGDQCVEVLVCFKCDVLAMHLGNGDWDWNSNMLRAFGSARAKLLALCKEALPDDPVIQGQPDVRPDGWADDSPPATTTGTRSGTGPAPAK